MAKTNGQLVRVELTNNFHITSYTVWVKKSTVYHLTPRQAARVQHALCGVPDCMCGDTVLRTRGPQFIAGVRVGEVYQWESGAVTLSPEIAVNT